MSGRARKKVRRKASESAAAETVALPAIKTAKKPMPIYVKDTDEPMERGIARTLLRPSIAHAVTLTKVLKRDCGERGLTELAEELSEQCQAVTGGKMDQTEAMLIAQATTLDAIFGDLTRLAYCNWLTHLDAAERLMRVALRAQSQSRATLETLAEIKNPPVVIAKQANIAHGHQQVNNDSVTSTHGRARARETQSEQSKLLEANDGEWLDTGATGQAIGSDPAMETVGKVHGTEKCRG